MKKFLALLSATALVFGVLAGCSTNENTTVETTASALQTQPPEVVTEETTVAPEVTETTEAPSTAKAEEPKKEEKPAKENKPETPLSDPTKAKTEVKVSKEDAKKAVLAHAGLNEADVKFYKAELDRERAGLVYEVEFDAGKYEYDYEVDAETGKVLKAEKEFRD